MYFTLILENETGEQVNLSTTANQYMTSKIEGLNPPAGTISTSSYAGMNGSYLNNAFIEKRNVVIAFAMRGIGIEKRRNRLYHVVKPSRYIKIWYKTANIDVYAEGYVESCEVEYFTFPFRRAMLRFPWEYTPPATPFPPETAGRTLHECRSAMTTSWNGCTVYAKLSAVLQMCGWMEMH